MSAPSFLVLDEGPHHAVVVKPVDSVVVRARGVPGPTLLDLAQAQWGTGVRPVHRLDRGTTGCLVFAKTLFGQQALSDAFRRHLVEKRYVALVEGLVPFERLDIDARLLRIDAPEGHKGPLAWQNVDERGQRALTRVRVLARGEGASLVEARPETGRMHQIRVHLASVGHPLVGDALYGAADRGPHPWLHALALSFPAPDGGKRFVFGGPPPAFAARAAALALDLNAAITPIQRSVEDRARAEQARQETDHPRGRARRAEPWGSAAPGHQTSPRGQSGRPGTASAKRKSSRPPKRSPRR